MNFIDAYKTLLYEKDLDGLRQLCTGRDLNEFLHKNINLVIDTIKLSEVKHG